MKNEKQVFELYVSNDKLRPVMNAPFIQNGCVCATNGHALIRVAKSETKEEYAHSAKPNCNAVFLKTKKEEVITFKRLEELLAEVEQVEETKQVGKSIECEECEGTGEVSWEYKRWTENDECPVCDGSGYSSEVKHIPTGKMIPNPQEAILLGDKTFRAGYVSVLAKTMELMEIYSVVMKYNEKKPYEQAVFNFNINTDVLLMPYVR